MIPLEKIWKSSNLPTLPAVASKLLDLVRNPETVIGDVIQIVKVDPAISAKLVKAANSSYFGLRSEVKTIERAIPLLGTTAATTLALSFALTDDSLRRGPLANHYQQYWKQSIVQAAAAERFSARYTERDPSEFFLAGLLLDIGRLAMLKAIPEEYSQLLDALDVIAEPLAEQETASLGCQHAEVGSQLLQNWKFPPALVNAVAWHESSLDKLAEFEALPEFSLYAASALAGAVGEYLCGPAKGKSLERMRAIAGRWFALNSQQIEQFLEDCNLRIQQTGELLNVDMAGVKNSTDLMLQANEQLVQLALQAQAMNTQNEIQKAELTEANSRLIEHNRQLRAKAIHDPLTKIYNRSYFEEALSCECHRCQREANPLAIVLADVDHFKSINDSHGHPCGDAVLIQIANRLQLSVRASDIVARHGGEEFVILVHQPTEKGLTVLCERLRQCIASEPFRYDDLSLNVTCSLGAAIAIPGRREQNVGQQLIAAADRAMYASKSAGRNRVSMTSLVSEEDRQLHQQVTSHRFSRWLVQRKLLSIEMVSRGVLDLPLQTRRIGEITQESGFLTATQVQQILAVQGDSDDRFGTVAIRLGLLTPEQLVCALAIQHEDPKQLTASVIRLGLMSAEQAMAAYEEFMQSRLGLAVAVLPH